MKLLPFSLLLLFLQLLSSTQARTHAHAQARTHTHTHPKCTLPEDKGSTLQVIHAYSPCSPFKLEASWEETVAQMLAQDRTRLLYLSSLVARKSVAPVAWGRQVIQSPSYIVRVRVGTPAQSFLMALDTSNDAAWLPCNGCLGCPGSTLFASERSSSFKGVGCGTPQCNQVYVSI